MNGWRCRHGPGNADLPPVPRREILWLAIVFEAGLLVLAVALGWILHAPPFRRVQFGWGPLAIGIGATAPLLLAMGWSIGTRLAPIARLRDEVARAVIPLFARCSTVDLALIALLAGIGEEALFRGVLQTVLGHSLSPWLALTLASAAFGLAHLVTPLYALMAGVIGFYLGLLLIVWDNLLIPIVVHALYDFVALGYLVRFSSMPSMPDGTGRP